MRGKPFQLYATEFPKKPNAPHSDISLLISAPVTGAGLHAICTAVAGWGLTTAMSTGRRRHGVLGAVAGFVLHFVWNVDWPQSWAQPAPAVVYAVGLAAPAACRRSAY